MQNHIHYEILQAKLHFGGDVPHFQSAVSF